MHKRQQASVSSVESPAIEQMSVQQDGQQQSLLQLMQINDLQSTFSSPPYLSLMIFYI